MNKIHLTEVPIERSSSPKGRFRRLIQHISRALTGMNGLARLDRPQPFDVELVRLPAGALNWPYHSHSLQWEICLILSGRGQVRTPAGTGMIREGDCLLHPPGEPHQIRNTGAVDLVYYMIADNPPVDICHYPDTNKWALPGQPRPVKIQPLDVYDGEE